MKLCVPLFGTTHSCMKAVISGTKEQQETFCEKGFSGLKPKVGTVPVRTEVEVLDSSADCGDMVHVRVLTGQLKGEVGCITPSALSNIKP